MSTSVKCSIQRQGAALLAALWAVALVFAPPSGVSASQAAPKGSPPAPKMAAASGLRLYVLDCGKIMNMDVKTWGFQPGQVALPHAAVVCHLIVHPRGTLIWDVGVVPDAEIGSGVPGAERAGKSLRGQLEALGHKPEDITYLALSHYHVDHAANGNMFKASTWLVRKAERDFMFAEKPPAVGNRNHWNLLKDAKTTLLEKDEYDVFGDGLVTIKATVGHTPGHQVLVLKLPKTGPVILGGDLYHFPEQQGTDKVPTFEFNKEQSLQSRAMMDAYVKRTGSQFWIEHDFAANAKLLKSPRYYE